MLLKDFEFIEQEMDTNTIRNIPKDLFYKEIKKKVKACALKYFIKIKEEKNKKKIQHLKYDTISVQEYMSMQDFSLIKKKLLRAVCFSYYKSSINLKKLNQKKNLNAV